MSPAPTARASVCRILLIALVLGLLLLAITGRHTAENDLQVHQIAQARDELLLTLDEQSEQQFDAAGAGTQARPDANSGLGSRVSADVTSLDSALANFAPGSWPTLTRLQQLDLDLSRAALANATGRFSAAIETITPADQITAASGQKNSEGLDLMLNRILGDACSGLGQWQQALDHYLKAASGSAATIPVLQRIALCHRELGNSNDFFADCRTLAAAHDSRGAVLLMLAKNEQALADFQAALAIMSFLTQKHPQLDYLPDWLTTYENLACDCLILGQPGSAAQYLQAALALAARDVPAAPKTAAVAHLHLGDSFLAQLSFDAAIEQYDSALAQFRALPPPAQSQFAADAALARNNRGAALAAQGRFDLALQEFNAATDLLPAESAAPTASTYLEAETNAAALAVKLDVAVQYSSAGLELSTRPRLSPVRSEADLAVARAVPLSNSAQVFLAQRRSSEAVRKLLAASAIYSNIVEKRGQAGLAAEFAATLRQLAWLYATSNADELRNGAKAAALASKACSLTGWKDPDCLSALAAASAEIGKFSEAIELQQKAIDLAPESLKPKLRARIPLYQSGKPFRS